MKFILALIMLALMHLGVGSLLMVLTAYVNATVGGKPWFSPERKDRWSVVGFPPDGVIMLWPLFIMMVLMVSIAIAYRKAMEHAGAAAIRAGEAHRQRLKGGAP